jgi:hypothetical protein
MAMTTATAVNLAEPQARFLNTLYNLTHHRADGGYASFARFALAVWRADLPDRETLHGLVRSGLVRMRDTAGTEDFDPDEASEHRIINSHLGLTPAGRGWVEDNPRNALLHKVDASPLGKVTLRRALEVTDDPRIIRQVVDDGYTSVHDAETLMEVRLNRYILAVCPNGYILLPTPKIRKVLGPRA